MLGLQAELALIEDLAITYTVQVLDSAGLRRAGELCALYAALELGLADASMVVLAEQRGTLALATVDTGTSGLSFHCKGGAFRLVPR